MKNKMNLFGIALAAVLAIVALGTETAFAQSSTPDPEYGSGRMIGWSIRNGTGGNGMMGGRGGMMGGFAQASDGWGWMNSMHQWMTTSGGMHTLVWNTVAEKLGLISDELFTELNSGKTLAEVAEDRDISRAGLVAAIEKAHQDSLAQAVQDGVLTQSQADSILAQMAGRYEWMLDNMGNGEMMSECEEMHESGMMNGSGMMDGGGMMGR